MVADLRRVLVVDHHRDAADTLVLLLSLIGHEARAAYKGPQAVELAMSFKPEFVFLDIGLPDFDGYTVATQIRALLPGTLVKLVAYSGLVITGVRERSLKKGFDIYLPKPVELSTIRKVLSGGEVAHSAATAEISR